MITYVRSEPGTPPRSEGLEVDDDGYAVAWRTAGNRVGRFARPLTAAERDELESARTVAAGDPDDDQAPRPAGASGVSELVRAEGVALTCDPDAVPSAVVALVERLRTLLDDLVDSPVAALELAIEPAADGGSTAVALRHLGDQPVTVRVATLTARATTFDAGSGIVEDTRDDVVVDLDGPVGAGWSVTFDDLHLPEVEEGGFQTVRLDPLTAVVRDQDGPRQVELGWAGP